MLPISSPKSNIYQQIAHAVNHSRNVVDEVFAIDRNKINQFIDDIASRLNLSLFGKCLYELALDRDKTDIVVPDTDILLIKEDCVIFQTFVTDRSMCVTSFPVADILQRAAQVSRSNGAAIVPNLNKAFAENFLEQLVELALDPTKSEIIIGDGGGENLGQQCLLQKVDGYIQFYEIASETSSGPGEGAFHTHGLLVKIEPLSVTKLLKYIEKGSRSLLNPTRRLSLFVANNLEPLLSAVAVRHKFINSPQYLEQLLSQNQDNQRNPLTFPIDDSDFCYHLVDLPDLNSKLSDDFCNIDGDELYEDSSLIQNEDPNNHYHQRRAILSKNVQNFLSTGALPETNSEKCELFLIFILISSANRKKLFALSPFTQAKELFPYYQYLLSSITDLEVNFSLCEPVTEKSFYILLGTLLSKSCTVNSINFRHMQQTPSSCIAMLLSKVNVTSVTFTDCSISQFELLGSLSGVAVSSKISTLTFVNVVIEGERDLTLDQFTIERSLCKSLFSSEIVDGKLPEQLYKACGFTDETLKVLTIHVDQIEIEDLDCLMKLRNLTSLVFVGDVAATVIDSSQKLASFIAKFEQSNTLTSISIGSKVFHTDSMLWNFYRKMSLLSSQSSPYSGVPQDIYRTIFSWLLLTTRESNLSTILTQSSPEDDV